MENDMENFECLVMWPKNTNGWHSEYSLVKDLVITGENFGFRKVSEMAKKIEDVWRKNYFSANMDVLQKELISDKENSDEWSMNLSLIANLLIKMQVSGFGRVPQLAEQIAEILEDKKNINKYKKVRNKYMKLMGLTDTAENGFEWNDKKSKWVERKKR